MRWQMKVALASLVVVAGCEDAARTGTQVAVTDWPTSTTTASVPEPRPTGDGLACQTELRHSAIYEYGEEAPAPDGVDPVSAAQSFFEGVFPDGAALTAEGTDVIVTATGSAVARVDTLEVPGGYVVGAMLACEGVLA